MEDREKLEMQLIILNEQKRRLAAEAALTEISFRETKKKLSELDEAVTQDGRKAEAG